MYVLLWYFWQLATDISWGMFPSIFKHVFKGLVQKIHVVNKANLWRCCNVILELPIYLGFAKVTGYSELVHVNILIAYFTVLVLHQRYFKGLAQKIHVVNKANLWWCCNVILGLAIYLGFAKITGCSELVYVNILIVCFTVLVLHQRLT